MVDVALLLLAKLAPLEYALLEETTPLLGPFIETPLATMSPERVDAKVPKFIAEGVPLALGTKWDTPFLTYVIPPSWTVTLSYRPGAKFKKLVPPMLIVEFET